VLVVLVVVLDVLHGSGSGAQYGSQQGHPGSGVPSVAHSTGVSFSLAPTQPPNIAAQTTNH
jgi:hypothetical protein